MQPARLDLPIIPGETLRKPFWLLQPIFEYRPISVIEQSAPLRLTVPTHGLHADWPVWIEGVDRWSNLNRDKLREPFFMALRIDDSTLELNEFNGIGKNASGGMLVYRPGVDLAGVTGRLTIRGRATIELTTENGGLVIEGVGQLLMVLTAEQSALITPGSTYDLDLTMSNGDVLRWLRGDVVIDRGGCHG
ncbi:hypothetical protein DN820_01740 [Stutzerimonas nosocomialis]|uniref:Uncharacterized protein n=1 Tax=Stutzerimonas nosocomialis TaxID=1056496 RepID=A0A5R9QIH9_9GAMM|nr:hypothetical protein [Stutzerimonas nosocomialis]TLX65061.1 hypothetical protein DN820_01740 [Stutzerimonas nosocomialis]